MQSIPTISYCRHVGLNCEPFKFTDNKYNFPGKKSLPKRILLGLLIWKFQYLKARRPRVTHHWTIYGSKYNNLYENLEENVYFTYICYPTGLKNTLTTESNPEGSVLWMGSESFSFKGFVKVLPDVVPFVHWKGLLCYAFKGIKWLSLLIRRK